MVWPPFVAAVAEELLLLLIDVFFNVVVVGADVFVAERRFDGGPVASTSPTWNKTEERRASRFVSIKRVSLFFFSMVKDTFFCQFVTFYGKQVFLVLYMQTSQMVSFKLLQDNIDS